MKKGEQTRQRMMEAAEELFCSKGFEETSVQDILDAVDGSKGGFYHHFASKEELLRLLCARRASEAASRTREALAALPAGADPMDRLNLVLQSAIPFRREELTFIAMLLPILDRQEGVSVRVTYQEALSEAFRPLLDA